VDNLRETGYCEHMYRRDVETCTACDLGEAEQALAAARAEAERLREQYAYIREEFHQGQDAILGLMKELDAARAEAGRLRELVRECRTCQGLLIKAGKKLAARAKLLRECREAVETRHDLADLLQRIEAELTNQDG